MCGIPSRLSLCESSVGSGRDFEAPRLDDQVLVHLEDLAPPAERVLSLLRLMMAEQAERVTYT